ARRKHGVRRFSAARVDRGARPLSPAPVHEPGRSARVLERHPGALGLRGDTQSLLPLYMIGVFISFTLSQAGMVIHWRKTKEAGWKTSAFINGFGAIVTGVVLLIVAVTKTFEGAWIVLILIPLIVLLFNGTRRHYDHVASQLTLR